MTRLPRLYPGARKRMSELAWSFPSLRKAEAVKPFHAHLFEEWSTHLSSRHPSARHAAHFLLQLWNPYSLKSFDVVQAFATWDDSHRRAFTAWATHPWWPRAGDPRFSVNQPPPPWK